MRVELPWPDPKLAPNRRNGKHWTVTHTAKLSAFGDAATLRTVGEIPCIVASVAVITLAYLAGSEFQRLVDSGIVISAEGESEAVVDANVEPLGVGDEGAAMLMESISSDSGEGGGGRGEIEDDFLGTFRLRSLSKSYDVDDPR